MAVVEIFTDGACIPNPGKGGWAAILRYKNTEKELSGNELHTTNNRMELMGAIMALELLKKPCKVVITSDSKYLINGATIWKDSWINNNFKNGKLKNIDLWARLYRAMYPHTIKWHWVKGHSGHPENERCDELAEQARISQ